MNPRENLLRTVRFEGPEYIPMTFHINGSVLGALSARSAAGPHGRSPVSVSGLPRGRPAALAASTRHLPAPANPLRIPGGAFGKLPQNGLMGIVTHRPLETWDALADYVLRIQTRRRTGGRSIGEKEAENVGPAISQKCLPNGEIGHNHTWLRLIDIRGYENALIDFHEREPRVFELLDMLEQFNMGLVRTTSSSAARSGWGSPRTWGCSADRCSRRSISATTSSRVIGG